MTTMLKNEEEYKVECTKFLNELLNKNSDLDAELQKDTADYIMLIGLRRVKNEITEQEMISAIHEVSQEEAVISSFVNWLNSHKIQQFKPKPQPESKKARVPEIYSTAKTTEPANSRRKDRGEDKPQQRPKKQEKTKRQQPKREQANESRHRNQKVEEEEPAPRKKMRTDNYGQGESEVNSEKQKIRCKHFPFCKKDNCPYFHPFEKVRKFFSRRVSQKINTPMTSSYHKGQNKSLLTVTKGLSFIKKRGPKIKRYPNACPYFPRCNFGQQCMKMHEPCKFLQSCTRPNCYYDHPARKNNFANDFIKLLMGQQQPFKKPFRKPRPQQAQTIDQSNQAPQIEEPKEQ